GPVDRPERPFPQQAIDIVIADLPVESRRPFTATAPLLHHAPLRRGQLLHLAAEALGVLAIEPLEQRFEQVGLGAARRGGLHPLRLPVLPLYGWSNTGRPRRSSDQEASRTWTSLASPNKCWIFDRLSLAPYVVNLRAFAMSSRLSPLNSRLATARRQSPFSLS